MMTLTFLIRWNVRSTLKIGNSVVFYLAHLICISFDSLASQLSNDDQLNVIHLKFMATMTQKRTGPWADSSGV